MATDSKKVQASGKRRLPIRQLIHAVALVILAIVIVGATIRLTIRDSFMLSGVIFYATPPAMMVVLLIVALLFTKLTSNKINRLMLALLVVAIGWTIQAQWVSNSIEPITSRTVTADRTQKMMFWNVCEGKISWDRVLDTIQQHSPDVLVLAEANTLKERPDKFFREQFPDYERRDLPRRIMLLSRLPIRSSRRLAWVRGCIVESAEIETETGVFTLVMSDVASTIFSHRKQPVQKLTEEVRKLRGPVMMVGDLNTPVDSQFFDVLRKDYTSAFEKCGNGLHVTWPMPLPVMAIDHLWGNRGINFRNVRILWTAASDHRPIIATFAVDLSQQADVF